MDASQVFEEAEECTSSNESGWTMYIASPMHDDDGDLSDGEEHDDDDNDDGEDNEGNDSDDSMLSDASSGPSHLLEPLGKVDGGIASFNNSKNKDEYDRKYYSYNKPNCRQMEKKKGERNTKLEKREASELVVNSSTSSVLSASGTKVRKFSWMGKSNN